VIERESVQKEETIKMTSKSKLENQEPGVDYENMLLKRFRIVEEVIEVAKDFNRDHGIDDATSRANVVLTKTGRQKKYERFLKQCINPDTNHWYSMEFLKAKQLVARIDSPYDGRQYPRREMFQLYRIKDQNKEFLNRREMWYGLTVKGQEIGIYVETLDSHMDVPITYTKLEESD
jgi:hypothetical protein